MAFSYTRFFRSDESGAISSMYAIAILPLIVMAGVAFDYGRMMGLDTELQNAADQAALAAATQLDGSEGARANAITAAANALSNQTRFATDGLGRGITVDGDPTDPDDENDGFTFFTGYEDDAPTDVALTDATARVVQVSIADRGVRYALTPVMAAFSGDTATGNAMATLQEATCNVPPLMFCQPNKADGSGVNTAFPTAEDVGKGLKLHFKSNAGACNGNNCPEDADETDFAPGNFGFLDTSEYLGLSQNEKNRSLGLNSEFLGCFGNPPQTRTGFVSPQGSALNTRLDIYGTPKNQCDKDNGDFCPSNNVRKTALYETKNNCNRPTGKGGPTLDFVTPDRSENIPDQGYPEDDCFLTSSCNVVGNNNNGWGSEAWMQRIHGKSISDLFTEGADLDGNERITRYEVYKWEQALPGDRLKDAGPLVGTSGKKYCSFPTPVNGDAVTPGDNQIDRRILTVAAVDCSRQSLAEQNPDDPLRGKKMPYIVKWVDLFLLKSVPETGSERDFFTEIKGPARLAGDRSAFQGLSRRKAVLLR